MDKKLENSIIRRIGGRDVLREVSSCGAGAGFPGFTYYSETVPFFKKHRSEILDLVNEIAGDMGIAVVSCVRDFHCLEKKYTEHEIGETLYGRKLNTEVANSLSVFALEQLAFENDR